MKHPVLFVMVIRNSLKLSLHTNYKSYKYKIWIIIENTVTKSKKKYYFPFKNPINVENWQMFHFPFLRHQKYIEDPLYFTLYINFIHTFNAYFTLYKINFGYIVLQIIKNICLFEILLYRNFLIFQYTTLNTKNKNIRHTISSSNYYLKNLSRKILNKVIHFP